MWDRVSRGAAECCRTLWQGGYEAYPVGGCVRDLLLGRVPGDWDVTTSAPPQRVMELFERTVPTGLRHGTVTVLLAGESIEVTTFRRELGYADGRHPDGVCFDVTLEQDLARRDFTVNAMALAPEGGVIDPFGGCRDLNRSIIRCVGEGERRFTEDALRMFRAVRFCAQLGFELEEGTRQAIAVCARRADCVAAERVRVEVEKTLCAPRPRYVEQLFAMGLMNRWTGGNPGALSALEELPDKPMLRWAGLCGALLNSGAIADAGEFLGALRLDRNTITACAAGQRLHKEGLPQNERQWRYALAQYGIGGCEAGAAMVGRESLNRLQQLADKQPCVTVEELALSGGELAGLGLRGPQIGAAQRRLLQHVLDYPQDNRKERLLRLLER